MKNQSNYFSTPPSYTHTKTHKQQKEDIKQKLDRILKRDIHILRQKQKINYDQLQLKDNNDLIFQYVQSVYQQYNILNPLPSKQYYFQKIMPSVEKKNKKTKISLTTLKKQQFNTPKRKQNSFINYKSKHIEEIQQQNDNINNSILNNTTIKASMRYFENNSINLNEETLNKKYKKNSLIHSFQQDNKFSRINQKYYIAQKFRYCIGCNLAILHHNIQFHQSICKQYQKVMDLEVQQIIDFLQEKIFQCQKNIKQFTQIINSDDAEKLQKFSNGIMDKSKQIVKKGELTLQYTSQYNKIVDISKNWCLLTQEINRVNWFLKIRQRLKTQLNI